jgi:hypothetical protein
MTTKEKAQELVGRYTSQEIRCISSDGGNLHEVNGYMANKYAKVFAISTVEEILEWTKKPILKNHFPRSTGKLTKWEYSGFWLSVKEELEKL